jgi:hypothetical protein
VACVRARVHALLAVCRLVPPFETFHSVEAAAARYDSPPPIVTSPKERGDSRCGQKGDMSGDSPVSGNRLARVISFRKSGDRSPLALAISAQAYGRYRDALGTLKSRSLATEWMLRPQIVNPARMVNVLAPGPWQ